MNPRLLSNFKIAVEAVISNRLRSLLTALGIIFGVAAVIAMLAIGNGAQQEILEQIKFVGSNNIVIEPIVEQVESQVTEGKNADGGRKTFTPGLTLADARAIQEIIPGVSSISPEVIIDTYIINNGIRRSAKLVGVQPEYFPMFNFSLASGVMFSEENMRRGDAVCIIGQAIQQRFFPTEDPIGKKLKVGNNWLEIIGVLNKRFISESSIENLGIRDYNMDVYAPLQTVLVRYENRSLVTESILQQNRQQQEENKENGTAAPPENYHQLDRLVVQVDETEKLEAISQVLARMMERLHYGTIDYQIQIPILLLKQQQRTNDIFNYVLGAIAGISLLVGGIGIMNIMLASVLERIKEIGLRLALGAKKTDIVFQFMFESMMISISGGIIGILLGMLLAYIVSEIADINTIISGGSVILAFGVAAGVGLIFGISPAKRAAKQNPINSLRYE